MSEGGVRKLCRKGELKREDIVRLYINVSYKE